MRSLVVFAALLVLNYHLPSSAQINSNETKKIQERLDRVEKRQEELSQAQSELYLRSVENNGKVSSFLGERISFGGFFENAITGIWGPDTENQVSANSHILGLNTTANFSENFRFSSQLLAALSSSFSNQHNNPSLTPNHRQYITAVTGAGVAQAFAEYTISSQLNIQTGIGYVPFGHAFQQRELVLFRRRGGPQLINSTGASGVGLAFPLWMGIHIHGAFDANMGRVGYNLYTFSPVPKTVGTGARLWWRPDENITVGASYQSGRLTADNYYSYGGDINIKFESFGVVAEYVRNVLYSGNVSPTSYYIEPYVTVAEGTWLIFAAADYFDNPANMGTTVIKDPFEKWQWGAGVNWLPTIGSRFRLSYLTHEYIGDSGSIRGQNRSYNSIDLSCGLAF